MDDGIACIDKVGLEELIYYHKAEFEIIDGCVYNEGRNNTSKHAIQYLYDLRQKLKQDETQPKWLWNCLWILCMAKLLLNQWKHILVLRITEMILKKYISYNYNYIGSVI